MIKNDKLTTSEIWTQAQGEDVKELMKEMKVNPAELALIFGVGEPTITRWMNNKSPIPYASWSLLCILAGYADIVESDDTIKDLEAKVERHKKLCLKYSVMLKKHTEKVFNENQDNNE